MLSDDEKREIDEAATMFPERRAAAGDALLIAQRTRGWIPDETLEELAAYLGLTAEELDSLATMYDLVFRRPVGRHVIRLCDSVSCFVTGSDGVALYLTEELGIRMGETSADGRFTLIPTACLGACDLAPAMLIDEDLYGNLTAEKIDEVLARYP
jgi:NADH-quinone oxidoreductase subunit E